MIGIKIGENISVLGDYRRNQITRTAHKFVQHKVYAYHKEKVVIMTETLQLAMYWDFHKLLHLIC